MMLFRRFFTFLFVFGFLFSIVDDAHCAKRLSKRVKSRNPYLITNIFSSAEEDSPSVSRAQAVTKANQIAFVILLKNLELPAHIKDRVSDEQIAQAVYSRQILDERIAGSYYSAKFNIAFLKSTVNSLLDDNESQPSFKEAGDKFLLFPVEVVRGREVLWEKNNLWRKSLEETISYSNVRNINVPKGDYVDIVNVNLDNIRNAKYSNFRSILSRYNAKSAIVAYFDFDKIENKVNIMLNIVDDSITRKVRLSFVNSKNLSRSGLLLEVAERTISHIVDSNAPKNKNATYSSTKNMKLNVKISDLGEWMMIKGRVERMSFVKKLKLESISRSTAKIVLTHDARNSDLANLFSSQGFLLRKNSNGEYFLSVQ
jgi:hypothetical protein